LGFKRFAESAINIEEKPDSTKRKGLKTMEEGCKNYWLEMSIYPIRNL